MVRRHPPRCIPPSLSWLTRRTDPQSFQLTPPHFWFRAITRLTFVPPICQDKSMGRIGTTAKGAIHTNPCRGQVHEMHWGKHCHLNYFLQGIRHRYLYDILTTSTTAFGKPVRVTNSPTFMRVGISRLRIDRPTSRSSSTHSTVFLVPQD